MIKVPSTSTSDSQVARSLPRLRDTPGTTLALAVLTLADRQCVGIDLASGTLVRAWGPRPARAPARSFDVIKVTVSEDPDLLPDPTQPEAVAVEELREPVGRISKRRAERLLRPVLHPDTEPLLGTHAPAVPFWERRGDHPSVAVVEPMSFARILLEGRYLRCRFGWRGAVLELPCRDRRLGRMLQSSKRQYLNASHGDRLLVALTPPVQGHCHKVVEAIIPHT